MSTLILWSLPESAGCVRNMFFTAADIARQIQGEVLGDGSVPLTGVAPADHAQRGELTYAENEDYFARAEQSAASAILADRNFSSAQKVVIRVPNARAAFARVVTLFFPPPQYAPGIHPSAVVASSAQVDPGAHVGPLCDCQLGEDAHLFPNVTLYPRTQIGQRVAIHSGTVIGSDGFGYVFDQGVRRKVPQVGNVVIHDDVEIGANVTIDRGALGSTVVGQGTKIDNLVQIGHNVVIGEHCIIIAQVGIAGSTRVGSYATLAGQVGIAGHLKVGNQVTVSAQAGVMNDIPDGEKWLGSPAQPDRQMKRIWVAMHRLPELLKRVSGIEKKLDKEPRKKPTR